MAIFHLAARVGSRGGGQSAAAAFAYLCQMGGDREERHDRQELVLAESCGLPGWAVKDPAAYWKAADRYERANGRLYQQVKIGLPRELSGEQQVALARGFAAELAETGEGSLPYTLVVHRGGGRNPHAHVLLSERVADGVERSPESWFRRAAVAGRQAPETGGARKTAAFQPRAWVGEVRARWAELANAALEKAGCEARIDHRSHRARGLVEIPTVHEGPRGMQARERGLEDDRVARNAEIRAANLQLGEIQAHSETAQRLVEVLQRQLGAEAFARPVETASEDTAAGAAAEVLRFVAVHRKDFRTRAEAVRWFDRETERLRGVANPATARGMFEESLVEAAGRAEFGNVLQQALVTPRWQEAPLSVGASLVQAEREIAEWRGTTAKVEREIAGHRDGRSLWRRLLGADPVLAELRRRRDAAVAQVELHRAALGRIEARWVEERAEWEGRAAAKNGERLERQRAAAERRRRLRPEVLAELERREEGPMARAERSAEQVEYIRRRLARGMTAEELWLDMLLRKDYSLQEQDALDALIRELQAERQEQRARLSWA
ncbi:MAG TPA: MobA/MobL family protein [Granulicella sp.]|nr:MobA/MobL family protein [Granulicella sp.]